MLARRRSQLLSILAVLTVLSVVVTACAPAAPAPPAPPAQAPAATSAPAPTTAPAPSVAVSTSAAPTTTTPITPTAVTTATAATAAPAAAAPAQAAPGKKFTVALVQGVKGDAFYVTMERGARTEANLLGLDLTVDGPQQFSAVQQTPIVDAMIAKSVDALLDCCHGQAVDDRADQAGQRRRHPGDLRRHLHRRRAAITSRDRSPSRSPTSARTTCSAARSPATP